MGVDQRASDNVHHGGKRSDDCRQRSHRIDEGARRLLADTALRCAGRRRANVVGLGGGLDVTALRWIGSGRRDDDGRSRCDHHCRCHQPTDERPFPVRLRFDASHRPAGLPGRALLVEMSAEPVQPLLEFVVLHHCSRILRRRLRPRLRWLVTVVTGMSRTPAASL